MEGGIKHHWLITQYITSKSRNMRLSVSAASLSRLTFCYSSERILRQLLLIAIVCGAAADEDDEPLFALATSHFDDSKG